MCMCYVHHLAPDVLSPETLIASINPESRGEKFLNLSKEILVSRVFCWQQLPLTKCSAFLLMPHSTAEAFTLPRSEWTDSSTISPRRSLGPLTVFRLGPKPYRRDSRPSLHYRSSLSKVSSRCTGSICDLLSTPSQTSMGRARLKTNMNKLRETALAPSSLRGSIALGGPASYGSYAVKKRMGKSDETVDLKGKRVLDLGCGNGCYTQELARRAAYVCGVDIQISHLKSFRQPIQRIQAAGENLPFASKSFDVVTMIEVLEHTRSDEETLEECFRVLKPGGLLVLFVPNKLYPFESHPCHFGNFSIGRNIPLISWFPESLRKRFCPARTYSSRKLLSLAKSAGFEAHQRRYIFPPLDSFRLPFKEFYRGAATKLEKTPIAKLGVSIYAVLRKPTSPETPKQIVPSGVKLERASFEVLGVRVHAVQTEDIVARMEK